MTKIILMDGAMGTTISSLTTLENSSREIFNLINPEMIINIHKKYIEAGATLVKTNSFNCSRSALEKNNIDPNLSYKLAFLSIDLARKAIFLTKKNNVKIAGSIGPGDFSQISGIIDNNPDYLLLETIYDKNILLNNLSIIKKIFKKNKKYIPIMISFSINKDLKIYSGEHIKDLINLIDCPEIISYGLNCSFGIEMLSSLIETLTFYTNKKISLHSNTDLLPDEFIKYIHPLLKKNFLSFIGGCCGTTYKHILKLHELILINS
ncbi:5-methyltetrahydrofolate--homocysteine methyltransferase [Cetobacterium ceti]|uniref:5-methyltetrahydrofolate--homocysteine methyltransferase n=1 Tax=Cetobacterium ceti TaxID=180163 RepID=A0A1T4MWF2_9FUSO|nr:homocysteine S-methyltransferase family protein [Cetobacterium ceti]SJZ71176.1 5-methyltetrahydrofolate--homocysteine methyltransferase [Cetobacterium ceti]